MSIVFTANTVRSNKELHGAPVIEKRDIQKAINNVKQVTKNVCKFKMSSNNLQCMVCTPCIQGYTLIIS